MIATTFAYTPRGWLATRSGGQSWRYDHDGVGQPTSLTMPDNSVITRTGDRARPSRIDDSAGNPVVYMLDNMGNRINEVVKDPGGAVTRQCARTLDMLNHLKQQTGGVQ